MAVAITVIMGSFVFLASIISISIFCVYLVAFWKGKERRHGKRVSIFVIYACVFGIPLAVSGVYSFEASSFLGANFSIYSAIVSFSLALTFMYTFLNVPLTIYHKKHEAGVKPPTAFPLITIIVPACNEEHCLTRTLDSLVEADYPNKEIIVVDDGSVDRTYSVASQYKKFADGTLFAVVRKPENGGKSSAINHGLLFAKGEYIVTVDADSMVTRDSLKAI
ncbi:MAG: glycosyltransferase family 2 protein, partial [Nitrososphaera sp.]